MNGNAQMWVKALLSDEFSQAEGTLRDGPKSDPEFATANSMFCCLGVACELYRQQTGIADWEFDDGVWYFMGEQDILPRDVALWLGIKTKNARLLSVRGHRETLYHLNDDGYTFPEIANIIIECDEELFD